MNRVDELQPGYWHGGTARFWGAVGVRTPTLALKAQGKSLKDAEAYLQRSIREGPDLLATQVFMAELKVKQGDKAAARSILRQVVAAPPASEAEVEAWNARERVRARRLLATLG
jgi:hypothetical protein